MLLGLNIGHDASLALTTGDGEVVAAVSEERFNRIKGFIGFPHMSHAWICEEFPDDVARVDKVVVGTLGDLNVGRATSYIQSIENTPMNYQSFGIWTELDPPGWGGRRWVPPEVAKEADVRAFLQAAIAKELTGLCRAESVEFARHHDAHAASGFFPSGFEHALVVSLDGQGDGESGLVAIGDRSASVPVSPVARIPSAHSLGHLYQAVTNRYRFNPGRHEGKITGLAAYGQHSALVEQLKSMVTVVNGVPEVSVPFDDLSEATIRNLVKRGWRHTDFLDEFFARLSGSSFEDLAFAIQDLVEKSVAEIVSFWLSELKLRDVTLSGGLFANVKINQKVSELANPGRTYVYPQMGDGGLAAGGIWNWLSRNRLPVSPSPHSSMFSGPHAFEPHLMETSDLIGVSRSPLQMAEMADAERIAEWLDRGLIVGVIQGRMEFGPRALGNRSLLADPRDAAINQTLNKRLQRTEFMPFAPVCLGEFFEDIFEMSEQNSPDSFRFMTMTCRVNERWRERIQAVVHIDATARPQLVDQREHPALYQVLRAFYHRTGIPCLINTSFNVHEEPIVRDVMDGVRAMRSGACDVVVSENYAYFLSDDTDRAGLWHQ